MQLPALMSSARYKPVSEQAFRLIATLMLISRMRVQSQTSDSIRCRALVCLHRVKIALSFSPDRLPGSLREEIHDPLRAIAMRTLFLSQRMAC
jgi:hypothetical protein